MAENRRVVAEIAQSHPVVDALVLAARYYRSTRHETAEGIEHNFALFYLSRYLFSHGLADRLEAGEQPVILNLAGPGGDLSAMNWDGLQFTRDYRPDQIMAQCGKLSDLAGVGFTAAHPGARIRYVLAHPGLTATGFTGDYTEADAALVAEIHGRGQPVDVAVDMLRRHLDNPGPEPLSAYMQHTKIGVGGAPFDPAAARRLADITLRALFFLIEECDEGKIATSQTRAGSPSCSRVIGTSQSTRCRIPTALSAPEITAHRGSPGLTRTSPSPRSAQVTARTALAEHLAA